MPFFDLHRHDERSAFDGFGKPAELVKIAQRLGYKSLGISNHGDMSGLVEHYFGCKNAGIKPILGNEVYFQPQFKEVRKYFHMCLFAKDLKGYQNLNKMVTLSNADKFYYKPMIDYELLESYSDGIICTSACVGGILSQYIIANDLVKAEGHAKKLKNIFGEDFYIEIQPYVLSEEGLQERVNCELVKIASKLDIKCILTSDSHFGERDDFDTYLKMHEIALHADFGMGYKERFMPSEEEIVGRFIDMHGHESKHKVKLPMKLAEQMVAALEEIENKVEEEILELLPLKLPVFKSEIDSRKLLLNEVKAGLKAKGKYNKQYIDRCKEEFDVITYHGFEDYFLIVQDYVKWAKDRDIAVGPGRGSVCNCLLAYALDITETDSILFDLDFRRFLRKDKKKLPDIDLDFETERRGEVIEYLLNKYEGHAARIRSYGLYKVDNLLNDLSKVCGIIDNDEEDEGVKADNEKLKKLIKSVIKKYIDPETGNFDYESAKDDPEVKRFDKHHDNIVKHFSKLYKKVRFFGTHAAGVAISGSKITDYTAVERRNNQFTTAYDLINIEQINAIKFDMLGLRTMSILKELRDMTGNNSFNYDWLNDEKLHEQFGLGNTDGIFQFESNGAKEILKAIQSDCIEDVVAASALNRPGPLSLGMVSQYASSKEAVRNGLVGKKDGSNIFYEYASDTYGCFVYQEQIMRVCIELGKMSWGDADKTIKFLKAGGTLTEKALQLKMAEEERLANEFVKGASENGVDPEQAREIFNKILVYAFNKGHAAGYTLISIEQMYYKVYHPLEFWYVTLKYADEKDIPRLTVEAVKDGNIILLPHVNYDSKYSIQKFDGDKAICAGMSDLKNVGFKAAEAIVEERKLNGRYKSYDDFIDRIQPYKRVVNKRVIETLKEHGALEFDKRVYISRVTKYNSSMFSRK